LIFRRSQQSQILRAYDGVRLEWDCLCRALACSTKEADMAFAIILGRLKSVDGGDPSATIYRLWSRANGLLMEPPKRKRVVRLAAYLRQQGKVKGADICQFLKA